MWVVQQDHYHDLLVPRVFLNITGCDARHDTFLVPKASTAFRLQFQPLRQEANSKVFDRNAEVESSIAISVHYFCSLAKKEKRNLCSLWYHSEWMLHQCVVPSLFFVYLTIFYLFVLRELCLYRRFIVHSPCHCLPPELRHVFSFMHCFK